MPRSIPLLGQAGLLALALGLAAPAQEPAADDPPPAGPAAKARPGAKKQARGRAPARARAEAPDPNPDDEAAPAADDRPSFARDVAPILRDNCVRCHGGEMPRSDFSQATFRGLMAGGKGGAAIEPGDPDASRLVRAIRREGPERPMPPENDRRLTEDAIGKIEAWVRAGARLDAGLDPAAPIERYAATSEQLRRAELAKLSPSDRDARLAETAKLRWLAVDPKAEPEMTSGSHFALFGNLPKDRAGGTLRALEGQYGRLRALLSRPGRPAPDWPEKVSVYVFNDRATYVEFVRSVENREVDESDRAHANLAVESPYLAAVDPAEGKAEPAAPARKSARTKKAAPDDAPGPDRSLAGLLSEQLAAAAINAAGKPPRWLSLGLGAYMAMQPEPRSPYYGRLRATAFDQFRLGWTTKATEALGGEATDDRLRAVGFALVEFLATETPALPLVAAHLIDEGGEKLDDILRVVLGGSREEFLQASGFFIGNRYGRAR